MDPLANRPPLQVAPSDLPQTPPAESTEAPPTPPWPGKAPERDPNLPPDFPTHPQALVLGQRRLTEIFDLLDKMKDEWEPTRELSLALTNIEQGALWFRQAVYLKAYEAAPATNQSEKKNL